MGTRVTCCVPCVGDDKDEKGKPVTPGHIWPHSVTSALDGKQTENGTRGTEVEGRCGQAGGTGLTVHQSVTHSSPTPCSAVGSKSAWNWKHVSPSGWQMESGLPCLQPTHLSCLPIPLCLLPLTDGRGLDQGDGTVADPTGCLLDQESVSFGEMLLSVFGEHEMLRDEAGHTPRAPCTPWSSNTLAVNSPKQ